MASNATVLDTHFELIGEVTPDDRKRVTLTKAIDSLRELKIDLTRVHFMVYCNQAGQILLSPETTIPLHEVWLYKNRPALESVLRGMDQAKRGKIRKGKSFAQHASDEAE
jgi:hypothetical protein